MARTQYPADEFDEVPAGSPVGAHRRLPRTWTRFAVFFAVVLTAFGLAWGAAQVILMADDVSWLNWLRPQDKPTATPTVSPTETPSPSPSPSPSVDPSDVPVYDFTAAVIVYDQSGVAGTGTAAIDGLVTETEFTSVTAGTWSGAAPPANVVRYADVKFEDSAKLVAEVLGIASVSLGPLETGNIAVILVKGIAPVTSPSPTP